MDIKEMKENGTIDYYLDLKKYIEEFVNRNYPLSKEDFHSISKDVPTENVIQRQETLRILNEAMKEVLTKVADRNGKIINRANEGIYTELIEGFNQEQITIAVFTIMDEHISSMLQLKSCSKKYSSIK